MSGFIDYAVIDACLNPDSYGEICVGCNMCGRISKETMYQDRYGKYIEWIKDDVEKFSDDFFKTELQQTNIANDISYYAKQLIDCIKHIDWSEEE